MFTFEGRTLLLQSLLTPDAVTPFSTLYMALVRGTVLSSDSGTTIQEVIGPGYARIGVPALSSSWMLTAHGELSNAIGVLWGAAGTGGWGLASGWALCSTTTAGLCLAGGDFLDAIQVDQGNVVALAPGMLILEVS